jgi:acyl-CoA reductase-like NAD-dependent aldehyde dehydrogenase
MRKLYYLIKDNIDEFAQALKLDLGKPLQEAMAAELGMTMTDILNVFENVFPPPPLLPQFMCIRMFMLVD